MMKTIKILKPYIQEEGKLTLVKCDLLMNDTHFFTLSYSFLSEFRDYLSIDVGDSFLVGILPYCLKHNYQIESTLPISEVLLDRINNYIVPVLSKNIPDYYCINIKANKSDTSYKPITSGTGLSCGVDSLYTIKRYFSAFNDSKKNVNCFCFFNVGSHGKGESGHSLFEKRLEEMKMVAAELEVPLLFVDTNYVDFYDDMFFKSTSTFRNISIPMMFQKLFLTYYLSSGSTIDEFCFDALEFCRCEPFLAPLLSTNTLSISLVGCELTRASKVKYISDWGIAQKHLNVCVIGEKNCGVCFKCRRTILELYLANSVEKFCNVFDSQYFYSHKKEYLTFAIINRKKMYMDEIYNELVKRKEITKYMIFRINLSILLRKLGLRKK